MNNGIVAVPLHGWSSKEFVVVLLACRAVTRCALSAFEARLRFRLRRGSLRSRGYSSEGWRTGRYGQHNFSQIY